MNRVVTKTNLGWAVLLLSIPCSGILAVVLHSSEFDSIAIGFAVGTLFSLAAIAIWSL